MTNWTFSTRRSAKRNFAAKRRMARLTGKTGRRRPLRKSRNRKRSPETNRRAGIPPPAKIHPQTGQSRPRGSCRTPRCPRSARSARKRSSAWSSLSRNSRQGRPPMSNGRCRKRPRMPPKRPGGSRNRIRSMPRWFSRTPETASFSATSSTPTARKTPSYWRRPVRRTRACRAETP